VPNLVISARSALVATTVFLNSVYKVARHREFLRVFGLSIATSALLPPRIWGGSSGLNESLTLSYKLDEVKLTPEDLVTS
jgi:hypothetical protein